MKVISFVVYFQYLCFICLIVLQNVNVLFYTYVLNPYILLIYLSLIYIKTLLYKIKFEISYNELWVFNQQ
jgi:hypothetical protein